jgi:hypothetical protein
MPRKDCGFRRCRALVEIQNNKQQTRSSIWLSVFVAILSGLVGLVHWHLEFEIYLKFDAWNLGFERGGYP